MRGKIQLLEDSLGNDEGYHASLDLDLGFEMGLVGAPEFQGPGGIPNPEDEHNSTID